MSQYAALTDMELAALVASKICHDVINPVGAIYNGLEILDEEDEPDARAYALEIIRNVTEQASARLQFARFAFGAAGSAGDKIDLRTAEQISRGYLGTGKHKLTWKGPVGFMAKDKVKLMLNLVALSQSALLRGGDVIVQIEPSLDQPSFSIRCRGAGARPPQHLVEFLTSPTPPALDALTIQAYFTCRLAESTGMRLDVMRDGADVVLVAES